MEHRIDTELAVHERQAQERTRRRWPDDGLPPSHKTVVRPSPHHPAALIAQLFWR